MNIGDKIKNAREENKLTQTQASESLMVSRQTISNWENGKSLPDILSVIRMSELYQISLDELLKGDKAMMDKIEKDIEIIMQSDYSLDTEVEYSGKIAYLSNSRYLIWYEFD